MNTTAIRHRTHSSVPHLVPALLATIALATVGGGCGGKGLGTGQNPTTYSIGRAEATLTDDSRIETYGPTAGGKRKLGIFIWYPSADTSTAPSSMGPMIPAAIAEQISGPSGIPVSVLKALPTKSHINSAIRPGRDRYPVIVMSHGNGGLTLQSSSAAEYLAARGYVVIGVSHTGNAAYSLIDGSIVPGDPAGMVESILPALTETSSFSDQLAYHQNVEAQAEVFIQDLRFVVDQLSTLNASDPRLKGRLDLTRIGVFGHSYGGSHSFMALTRDERIDAAADVDGTIWNSAYKAGTTKPLMVFTSVRFTEAEAEAIKSAWRAQGYTPDQISQALEWTRTETVAHNASRNSILVGIQKATHNNYTDEGIWAPYGYPADNISTQIPASFVIDTYHKYLGAFFDEHLKNQYQPILHRPSEDPNVVVSQSAGR